MPGDTATEMAVALLEGIHQPPGLWEGVCIECTMFFDRNRDDIRASVMRLLAEGKTIGTTPFQLLTSFFNAVHTIPEPGHGDL